MSMTREEAICNAARERADRHEIAEKELHNYNSQLYFYDRIYNAEIASFEAGVEWAYNHPVNVWHDASEKPHAKKRLLVQFDKDDYKILSLKDSHIDLWCDFCKILNFISWAYIEDLLPK